MEWRVVSLRYGTEKRLYLGRLAVASVSWNSCRSKSSNLTHVSVIDLPGIKRELVTQEYPSEEEAMLAAELMVRKWINGAGLLMNESALPTE